MAKDFIKIDLHIHTPASDCYKGESSDDEFLKILKRAKAENLKIIAVTDHNSIEGYLQYLKIRHNLINRKNELMSHQLAESSEEIKRIERELSLFDEIIILPGIEFEVKNNVHMLIIFNPNTPIERLYKFLYDSGYRDFGKESPTVVSNWDILDLYDNSRKYDCIIIDAHTDSNKGIWNTIAHGSYRASCFTSPHLYAIGYKSESQKDNIEEIFNSNKAYRRVTPISFVRFSDAHSYRDVGSQFTWLRKPEIFDFAYLQNAFKNPSEYISVEEPSLAKILNNIVQQTSTFGIPDITEENLEYFRKLICGLNNSEGGYVLFGLTSDHKKRGISIPKGANKKKETLINQVEKCVNGIDGIPKLKITIYPYMSDSIIISVNIQKSPELINIKDEGTIYSIRNNKLCVLSAMEIKSVLEEKFADDMEMSIGKRIEDVERECKKIRNYFSTLPILKKFELNSEVARFPLNYEESIDLSEREISKLKKAPYNGFSRGNIFFLQEYFTPRLDYTYLRYSLPMFTIQKLGIQAKEIETIYIVASGSVFYSHKDYPYFFEEDLPVIKLHENLLKSFRAKFITCFLKSSLMIFYCMNRLNDNDIYMPEVFERIRLPRVNVSNPNIKQSISNIEVNFDKIVDMERGFLIRIKNLRDDPLIKEYDRHNSEVDKLAYEIDNEIYKMLNILPDEINVIEDYLRLNNIYLPTF